MARHLETKKRSAGSPETIELEVSQNLTLAELKEAVLKSQNIHRKRTTMIKFIYEGEEIADSKTLQELGVSNDETLNFLVGLREQHKKLRISN